MELLLCQREPRRRAATVVVRDVRAEGSRWLATTDDTVLYPEGGGQPADRGTLGGVEVLDLHRSADGPVHVLAAPVPPGEAEVVVDWGRRYDHMQQHTGQHLLTAVAQDRFGWVTTSFHLHVGLTAACDLELDALVPDAAVPELEALVNERIRAALPVAVRTCGPGELAALGVRSRGLPPGHEGPVRLVEIAGVDLNTCGGTHVASTAELQALALLGTERVRGGTRLSFVVGGRVLARLAAAEARTEAIGRLLSRPPSETVDGVERLLADQKAAARAREVLSDELLEHHAARLLATDGLRHLHREASDPAWSNRLASRVLAGAPDARVFVTGGTDGDVHFVLAGPRGWVDGVRSQVLSALQARGGGPPGRLQGNGTRLAGREELLGAWSSGVGRWEEG